MALTLYSEVGGAGSGMDEAAVLLPLGQPASALQSRGPGEREQEPACTVVQE